MVERLYIHVPFCASKCGYCAFTSEPAASPDLITDYLRLLRIHAERIRHTLSPLESIFIGGGTPTYLQPVALDELLQIARLFPTTSDMEFSVECNPESLSYEKSELLANHGVNRVSLGVQTFVPRLRKILGRSGDPEAVIPAIGMLRDAGIARLNADLIYAIPTQQVAECREDTVRLLDLGIEHLSAYSLTADEGSRLFRNFDERETEAVSDEIWERLPEWTTPYGLKRYEISNYAKPEAECRHNLAIWHGVEYIGIGPAAASFVDGLRHAESDDVTRWLRGESPTDDPLPAFDRAAEILAFGLRTVAGWDDAQFHAVSGYRLDDFSERLSSLIAEGWIQSSPHHISPTDNGLRYWNALAEHLI